ncbi:MAG: hypothetical protein ABR515_03080 [Nitrososphaeraceae archaeon]
MKNFKPLLIYTLAFATTLVVFLNSSQAHIDSVDTQFWEDPQDNLEIEFGYEPEEPIIDAFTNLSFSITDWRTGEHVKDYVALVTITQGERLFRFQNITVPNGDFSVDYLFPEDGTHQVLLRVDTNNSIHVASFQVFVPHQSPPELLNDVHNVTISLGILIAITGITIVILRRR